MNEPGAEQFGGRDRPFGETVAPGTRSARIAETGIAGVRAASVRAAEAGQRSDPFSHQGPVPTGGPPPGYVSTTMPKQYFGQRTGQDGLCTASLIFGLLSLPFFILLVGGIVAIVCGHMGRHRVLAPGATKHGAGAAFAGLICGYLSLALFMLYFAAI